MTSGLTTNFGSVDGHLQMNPVVVLLLALNGAAQLVEAQPVAFHPFGALNRPARVTFDAAQPLRTRSLPQPSLSIDNHAGIF